MRQNYSVLTIKYAFTLTPTLSLKGEGVLRDLRARAKITSHFRISSSGHLRPIFTHTILNVGVPALAVVLLQVDQICPKSEREFCEGIFARTLS